MGHHIVRVYLSAFSFPPQGVARTDNSTAVKFEVGCAITEPFNAPGGMRQA